MVCTCVRERVFPFCSFFFFFSLSNANIAEQCGGKGVARFPMHRRRVRRSPERALNRCEDFRFVKSIFRTLEFRESPRGKRKSPSGCYKKKFRAHSRVSRGGRGVGESQSREINRRIDVNDFYVAGISNDR